jgi:tRNA 2-selenouridine synthase
VKDVEAFCARLDALRVMRGKDVVAGWQSAAREGRLGEVVHELLEHHYDPIYLQSMARNFPGLAQPMLALAWDGTDASLDAAASRALADT